MRVEVDEDACISSMCCQTTCPQVFRVVGGIARVQLDLVPSELEEKCRQVAENCPAKAVKIIED